MVLNFIIKTSLNFLPFTHLFTELFLPDTSVSWLMLVPSRPTRTPKLWQKREWNTEMKTVHSSRLLIVICGTPLLCLYLYFNTIYIIIIYKHRYQLTACKPLAIENRKHHNGRQSNLHYWVKQQTEDKENSTALICKLCFKTKKNEFALVWIPEPFENQGLLPLDNKAASVFREDLTLIFKVLLSGPGLTT